jgi:hypothetical protein
VQSRKELGFTEIVNPMTAVVGGANVKVANARMTPVMGLPEDMIEALPLSRTLR